MPGVPSGRGCGACRAQKKKCDQSKPSCSRCKRLQITCTGSGQQRYKFKHQEQSLMLAKDRQQLLQGLKISPPPSNAQTLLTCALIDKFKTTTDLRYHLSWTYGSYLEDVPQRLGNSEALDAAVDALVCAHSNFAGPQRIVAPESLQKYCHAIATLRASLDNPLQARTADTLCAVKLLLLCQTFTGVHEGLTSHCEGAAQILKVRGYYDKNDEFERKLLLALRGPVVDHLALVREFRLIFRKLFQALISDTIRFSPGEWEQIVENDLDGLSDEGRMIGCLARIPDIIKRGRAALEGGGSIVELREKSRSLYHGMKLVLGSLHNRFRNQTGDTTSSVVTVRLHSHYQRGYALGLAISIILNCILSALDAQDVSLEREAAEWSKEIIKLADDAAIYRPIAASYMSTCLVAAWEGSRDDKTKSEAKGKLEDYLQDFSYTKVVVQTAKLEAFFQRIRLKAGSMLLGKEFDQRS